MNKQKYFTVINDKGMKHTMPANTKEEAEKRYWDALIGSIGCDHGYCDNCEGKRPTSEFPKEKFAQPVKFVEFYPEDKIKTKKGQF